MKELTHYKTKLEVERKIIVDDMKAISTDFDNSEADPNEVADKIESFEANIDLREKLQTQLTDIDTALEKIKNNTYGICEIGREEIEEDRLEANPSARTCKKHMNTS